MDITTAQIRKLAKTSNSAMCELRAMFPQAFEPQPVKVTKAVMGNFLCTRNYGEYKDYGFYLDGDYNWVIKTDDAGELVLVPTTKEE